MRRNILPVAIRMFTGCRLNSNSSTETSSFGSREWSPIAPENTTNTATNNNNNNAAPSPPAPLPSRPPSEAERWWPSASDPLGKTSAPTQIQAIRRRQYHRDKEWQDGIVATPLRAAPSPLEAPQLEEDGDMRHELLGLNTVFEHERQFVAPPTFDPAIDDLDESMHVDARVTADVTAAIEADRRRLEAFANPMSVEGQVQALLQPQRDDQNNLAQRADFNGFSHWGLLQGAMITLEEQRDYKRAHQLVNRYMRDQDLFVQWLKHPKVVAHIEKKFGVDISNSYDKLMGLALSMYIRGKIMAFEGDMGGALKSLTACVSLVNEGGDLELNERHRKVLGATLAARGAVLIKLKSFERANEDFTTALGFVPVQRAASLFQLRAEAREQLGLIEEARRDEEHAAHIWETADVITPGMDGEPTKFVV